MDWFPHGFVLFRLGGEGGGGGLYVQPAAGGEKILVSESVTAAEFSPDSEGRWIA